METKLAEYRAKKAKEKLENAGGIRNNTSSDFGLLHRKSALGIVPTSSESECSESTLLPTSSDFDTNTTEQYDSSEQSGQEQPTNKSSRWTAVAIADTCLKVLLWFTLWAFFTHLEFGAPYFVISLLYVLYKSLRTGPRDKKKLSAYSVFNPNCERLDGTFTAEQFEKELRYGPASVR